MRRDWGYWFAIFSLIVFGLLSYLGFIGQTTLDERVELAELRAALRSANNQQNQSRQWLARLDQQLHERTELALDASGIERKQFFRENGEVGYRVRLNNARLSQIQLLKLAGDVDELDIAGRSYLDHASKEELIEEVVSLSNLRKLRLANASDVSTAVLEPIGSMASLESLTVWLGSTQPLPSLPPSLKKLRVVDGAITRENIEAISKLSMLDTLDFMRSRFTSPNLTAWSQLANLTHLRLIRTEMVNATPQSFFFVEDLPLTLFHVESSNVDNTVVDYLLKSSRLTDLILRDTDVDDYGVHRLIAASDLVRLELDNASVTDLAMADLAQHSCLDTLKLRDTGITDETLGQFATMRCLRVVDLTGTKCTAKGLQVLASLPRLEEVALNQLSLSEDLLSGLAALPNLKTVSLTGCDGLTAGGLKELIACESLDFMELQRGGIVTDELLAELESIHGHVWLNVVDASVTAQAN